MGYFEIGLFLGVILYLIFIALLTFNEKFKVGFYGELFENTLLGDTGEYLFFPTKKQIKDQELGRTSVSVAIFIGIHACLLILHLIVFVLLGGLLAPVIVLCSPIALVVYFVVKRKRQKRLNMLKEDEQTS